MKRKLTIVSSAAIIITMIIGILALIGWFTHRDFFKSILPGAVNLKFNAALCFVFSSVVLMLNYSPGKNKIQHFVSLLLSIVIFLTGLLTLIEYIGGINIGIDELFVRDMGTSTASYFAGRTSPLSAMNFLLIGIGLLLLNKQKAAGYHYFYLPAIAFTCLLILIGFHFVTDIPALIRISTPGVIGFITLTVAIWFAQPMLQKKISFERRLFAGFTAVIILIAIISLFSLYYKNKLISTSRLISHTNKVLSESEQTLSLTNEMESGGRGYIITGDSDYLRYYTIAKNTVFNHVIQLKLLTKDNPGNQVRIDSLSALIEKRVAFSELCNKLVNEKKIDLTHALNATRVGKLYTDKIRIVIAAIQQEENNLLALRQRENDKSIVSFKRASFVFLAVIFILLLIILFSIRLNTINRKRNEEIIRFKAELLNTIGQAVIATSLDGSIIFWNRAAEKIYGWTADEAIGKNIIDLTPVQQAKEQARTIMEQLRQGHPWSGEFMVQRKDGFTFPVFVTNSPVYDYNNKLSGIIGVSFDITELKKSEDAVKKAYEERNTVLERIDDGFFAVDKNSIVTYWNKKAEILLSVKKEDILGKNLHDTFAATATIEFHDHYQKAIRENKTVHFEEFSKRTNKWFAVSAFASDNGLSVYFKDITERKQGERLLIESEAKYRSFFDYSIDGILMATKEGRVIAANPAACVIFGMTEAEICLTVREELVDMTTPQIPLFFEERARTGKASGTFTLFRKGGEKFLAEVSSSIFKDANGDEKSSLIVRDISGKKATEDLLDKATSLAKMGSWEVDMIKNTVYFSAITKEIHEVEPDFVPDMQTGISFYKEGKSRDMITEVIQKAIESGKPWDIELQIITAKGNEKWVRTIGETEFVNGKALKIKGGFQDITDRKHSDMELYELNESLQQQAKELFIQNEEKEKRAAELIIANKELAFQNDEKEKRAAELIIANKELAFQNDEKEKRAAELAIANEELAFQNEEKEKRAAELFIANKELAFQNDEKENRAAELFIANKELVFQNDEKEKRAAELFIANKELAFQNDEKENRAAELFIANKELVFQNDEKEKRAAELVIANKELAFQNKEKEKRAAELFIANEELAFQNDEKENRAAELFIANKELVFQNDEKEKRAAELVIANKELAFQNDEKEKRAAELSVLNENLQNQTKELAISNADLEQFAYVASHDLQEPLRMVTSFLTQLEKKYADIIDEKGKQYIGFAVDGAIRMRQIILDLLEFSRVGRTEELLEDIDLNEMVKEIQILFRNQIEEKNAVIKVDQLPVIHTYKVPLLQVFQNLIGNALKYTRDDACCKITIAAGETATHWEFAITDNGIGIDEEYFDKIFIIFQRLHTKNEYPGTGMGLAVTKKIIENLGGKISVESQERKGSTFFFTIKK